MGLFDWNKTDEDEDQAPIAVFQFESGDRCEVCGKQHADQWHCNPEIPNPWGSSDEE